MKVPSFKTKKIRTDIFAMVDKVPTRSMYEIVLRAIDHAMDQLAAVREEIPASGKVVTRMLRRWDTAYTKFGEREAFYYQDFLGGEDREEVDAPLFEGKYGAYDFEGPPTWPDIETPWRLANDLSTIAASAGATQAELNELLSSFEAIISSFWEEAHRLLVEQKDAYEKQAKEEGLKEEGEEGRIYGFVPVLVVGAVALVGLFGAAAGYSASQSAKPGEYVESSPLDKHMKTAKSVGVGVAIGALVAMLLVLRGRR